MDFPLLPFLVQDCTEEKAATNIPVSQDALKKDGNTQLQLIK